MFTQKEEKILQHLQQNAGEIKFFEDIAAFFITKSELEISTFSQLAFVNLPAELSTPANVTDALSEFFEVLIFIRKLEQSGNVFHIPYTALQDNTVKIGVEPENSIQTTIADADLLIQLFQYASKKYVFKPVLKSEISQKKGTKKSDFFRIAILFLLIIFIGFVAYHAHIERKQLLLQQKNIVQLIDANNEKIIELEVEFMANNKLRESDFQSLNNQFNFLKSNSEKQQNSLSYLKFSNRKQNADLKIVHYKLDSLIRYNIAERDSLLN